MNDNDLMTLKKALETAINEYANSGKDEDKEVADKLLGKAEKVLAEERMRLCEIIDEDEDD